MTRRLTAFSSLAAAILGIACHSTVPTRPSAASQRIAVLGDSLAVSPSQTEAFPAVLESRLTSEGLAWTVTNASVSGSTTADGVDRLDSALSDNPAILVVALGGNDGLQGVAVLAIRRNLARIVSRAQARGVVVLLCGMEMPPLHGWDYTFSFHDAFPDVAREAGVPLVPFLLDGVLGNPLMNRDLVHPNAAGARRIASNIWPYLEPLVRQVGRIELQSALRTTPDVR